MNDTPAMQRLMKNFKIASYIFVFGAPLLLLLILSVVLPLVL